MYIVTRLPPSRFPRISACPAARNRSAAVVPGLAGPKRVPCAQKWCT